MNTLKIIKPKKGFIAFIFILLFIFLGSSQAQMLIAQFKDANSNWGYLDISGNVIIPAIFSASEEFCPEGIALVKDSQTKQYKYINTKGEEIKLNFQAQELKPFFNGRAAVCIDDKWGFIDVKGNLAVSNLYDKVYHFSSNRAFVIDTNDVLKLIDLNGNTIDISLRDIDTHKNFNEGFAAIERKGEWGFIDTTGKLIIEPKYVNVGKFSMGVTWVMINNTDYTFINKNGEIIFSDMYIYCREFDPISGMARVKSRDGWFYIDIHGNKLITNADHHFDFWGGLCKTDTTKKSGLYGFKNNKGEWMVQPIYTATQDFHNGVCCVRVDGKWGVIDTKGNYLIKPIYNGIEKFVLIKSNQ